MYENVQEYVQNIKGTCVINEYRSIIRRSGNIFP